MAPIPIKDHLGNEYPSISAMCARYGLPHNTLMNRLRRGWDLEDALTHPAMKSSERHIPRAIWHDHLGNEYNSVREMCETYGITERMYWSRKRVCKWPLEKILTTPRVDTPPNSKAIRDHLGNVYPSISAMCRAYNIKLTRYRQRISAGWSVERALTEPAAETNDMSAKSCRDHLGNIYPSQNAMCRAYGLLRHTLRSRLELGWTLEKALTTPNIIYRVEARDYMGRVFPTLKDMANFYGVGSYRLQGQGGNAASLIERLSINRWKGERIGDIDIIDCPAFPYFKCRKAGKPVMLHLETILAIYHNSDGFQPLPETKIEPRYKVIRRLGFPFYEVEHDGSRTILSYFDIVRLDAEGNFGLSGRKGKKDEKL